MRVLDVRTEASSSGLMADRSKIEPKERVIDPREFRRETESRISNVSDEELIDLLE
jgi:hypothetical protein